MALSLPLELQQQIFGYLDSRAYYASRHTCSWWNAASKDPVTLTKQLRKLPISPDARVQDAASGRLQSLYVEAANTLMLGARVNEADCQRESLESRIGKPKIAISEDSQRAVSLDNRQIALYDLKSSSPKVLAQRPINDLRSAIGGGPWFKCAPTSVYELALSQSGTLLAIALERTIQVYDLSAGDESWPIASYINSASGHFIASLRFEHNDSLLRVQLSNKGTVLYLGKPKSKPADLAHWQGKGGLKHAFIDTSKMVLPEQGARLAGLQILKELENGYLFAAQKHVPTSYPESTSNYVLGHISIEATDRHVPTAATQATVLADLDIAHPNILVGSSDSGKDREQKQNEAWPALPTAKESHCHFSLSDDGILLALTEARTGSASTKTEAASRVFVYRVPSTEGLGRTLLAAREAKSREHETGLVETVGENEVQDSAGVEQQKEAEGEVKREYTVRCLPLYLGEIKGQVMKFGLERVGEKGGKGGERGEGRCEYQVGIVTDGGEKRWCVRQGC